MCFCCCFFVDVVVQTNLSHLRIISVSGSPISPPSPVALSGAQSNNSIDLEHFGNHGIGHVNSSSQVYHE